MNDCPEPKTGPTIFHVTHWKAGSQWVHRILLELAHGSIVPPEMGETQFLSSPLRPGAVYPTVYVSREQFQSVRLPEGARWFVIIRDLRDTLVSIYFSTRYSHPVIVEDVITGRQRLNAMSLEDGLLMLLDEWLPMCAAIQSSWIASGERIIRYEDLLHRDVEIFEEILIGHCGLAVSPERLREVVLRYRFEQVTGGRRLGEEDIHAHERKGIPGDWRNYFTPRVAARFNERFGDLLEATGYARDGWERELDGHA